MLLACPVCLVQPSIKELQEPLVRLETLVFLVAMVALAHLEVRELQVRQDQLELLAILDPLDQQDFLVCKDPRVQLARRVRPVFLVCKDPQDRQDLTASLDLLAP